MIDLIKIHQGLISKSKPGILLFIIISLIIFGFYLYSQFSDENEQVN